MAIGEKVVEIGLAGASAAIATFAIFLWNQTENLEREISALRVDIARIEKTGEVEVLLQQECEGLGNRLVQAKIEIKLSVVSEIKELLKSRGCFDSEKDK